jgi:nucleoside-diphosphate-sugar epimerase
MRFLVTGGAGYLGSLAARTLLARGHHVRVLDCLRYGGTSLLSLYEQDRFIFQYGDVRSAEDIRRALEGVDTVVHLAAIVGDPACARQPDLAWAVNYEASLRLLECSRGAGVRRFVFASTCSNYGKMRNGAGYVTEESELRPVSLYAETKVGVERALLEQSADRAPEIVLLRFATLFGLSPRMRFDLTVNEFTKDMLTKGMLDLYGEQFWRPYVHVRDAAEAIRLAAEAPTARVAGEVFNVGETRENYQKGALVKLIQAHIGRSVEVTRVALSDDPRDYRVSFEKVKDVLGFHAVRTVPDGIREVADVIMQRVIIDPDAAHYRN